MSIASQLTTLAANKAAIKAAIAAKNPATAPTNALAQWPAAIASIPSGGGLTGYKLTMQGSAAYDSYTAVAIAYADGSVEVYDSYSLYTSETVVKNDVVAYAKCKGEPYNDIYKVVSGTTVILSADTTIYVNCPCLLRGTLVTLADGSEKPIEDVTYDDDLLVWDFGRGVTSSAKPLWIKMAQRADYMFDVQLACGRTLGVTGPHGHRAFNIHQGRFEYLPRSVGDRVWTLDGVDEVVSCAKVRGDFEHYNIITADHLNLFANGVLTSCRLNNHRGFNAAKMTWASKAVSHHSRSAFDGIPPEFIDGLHLCEQPMSVEELTFYVGRLAALANT